jgi:hypothetical protein
MYLRQPVGSIRKNLKDDLFHHLHHRTVRQWMQPRLCRWQLAVVVVTLAVTAARGGIGPEGAALHLDFEKEEANVTLAHGAHRVQGRFGGALEFTTALQYAQVEFPRVLDHTLPLPVTFYEFTALIAPRPFLCGQAVGERRPMEEENYAAVKQVYDALGFPERVRYHWYASDHDYLPEAQQAAVEWFQRWFAVRPEPEPASEKRWGADPRQTQSGKTD